MTPVVCIGEGRIKLYIGKGKAHMTEQSLFAQYLVDWAKSQPGLLISRAQLARILDQPRQSVAKWLTDNRLPEIETLIQIHESTKRYDLEHPHSYLWDEPGIPLRMLLSLKGTYIPMADDVWAFIEEQIKLSDQSPTEKQSYLAWLNEVRDKFYRRHHDEEAAV
jgi:hypothetical protein